MTNIAGAIGRVQLKKLPKWTESRIANAAALSEGLADLADVETPYVDPSVVHVFHQYTIRLKRGAPEELQEHLKGLGIDSGVYYPTPVHLLRPFADQVAELPETDRAASSVLSLPVHPSLSADDLRRVAAGVRSYVSGKA
jgi:dTDP-4-amino-4,6-dideoxygalactose transaminase